MYQNCWRLSIWFPWLLFRTLKTVSLPKKLNHFRFFPYEFPTDSTSCSALSGPFLLIFMSFLSFPLCHLFSLYFLLSHIFSSFLSIFFSNNLSLFRFPSLRLRWCKTYLYSVLYHLVSLKNSFFNNAFINTVYQKLLN